MNYLGVNAAAPSAARVFSGPPGSRGAVVAAGLEPPVAGKSVTGSLRRVRVAVLRFVKFLNVSVTAMPSPSRSATPWQQLGIKRVGRRMSPSGSSPAGRVSGERS